MTNNTVSRVQFLVVDEQHAGQRIDNFLFTKLKGLPKSRIYKALRKGEVRVNKKRARPELKLKANDQIRIPPLRIAEKEPTASPGTRLKTIIKNRIIFEDNDLIVLNKPAGIAVHGGSGISFGVIEILRSLYPKAQYFELIHRLDRDTSGCLMVAKKSSILKEVHALLAARNVSKTYWLLVAGACNFEQKTVTEPLQKNILKSGERIVVIDPEGKPAKTLFRPIKVCDGMTLLEAKPITGRTHQIRVHAAYLNHPIIGDEKYGDEETNKKARALGINQLCLHSSAIELEIASKNKNVALCAVLDEPWAKFIR